MRSASGEMLEISWESERVEENELHKERDDLNKTAKDQPLPRRSPAGSASGGPTAAELLDGESLMASNRRCEPNSSAVTSARLVI